MAKKAKAPPPDIKSDSVPKQVGQQSLSTSTSGELSQFNQRLREALNYNPKKPKNG